MKKKGDHKMEWTQVIAICAYLTTVCAFFYYINEKTIKEWRLEHEKQIQKSEKMIKEWRLEHQSQMQRMDEKWERLFERLLLQDQQRAAK